MIKAFRRHTDSLGRLADNCTKIIEKVEPHPERTLKDIVSAEISDIYRAIGIQDQLDTGATTLAMMYLENEPNRPYVVFERLALLNNMIRGCEATTDPDRRLQDHYKMVHAEVQDLMHLLLRYRQELRESFPLAQP